MPSPAECVAWFLNLKGVASTNPLATSWPIRIGQVLETPDACIGIYDTGGTNPNTKWLLDFVHVQTLVRGAKDGYQAAYAKAQAIKDVLLGVDPQLVYTSPNQVWWSGITMLGDIAFLNHDLGKRPLFSVNFRILQEQPKSTLSNRDPLDYYGP